ncbi:uncharacterized protein LOC143534914 [Bidens hawaiensis]|uniref:uncharacterized protein LOC143534914 n=1 Tax=Bidens hawaiensis TaxID=980011 RepID=UPI00404A0AC7
MGRTTNYIRMSHRVLSPNHNYATSHNPHDQQLVQLCGSIFGFLEEDITVSSSPGNDILFGIQQDDDEREDPEYIEDKIKFWETQHENLHTTHFKTTILESEIRNITKEVLRDFEMVGNVCSCPRPVLDGCQSCRMRKICRQLQKSGYDSGICKSKWNNSLDFPSGEHTFLDVIDSSNPKKESIRVIIELELRGQFEMKKGSNEYNSLVCKLPDVFVGKSDRLQTIIQIISNAAKECMREKKVHLGPWRKQRYMQAKWLRVMERSTVTTTIKPLVNDE